MNLILKETTGLLPTSNFELQEDGVVIGTLQLRHTPSKSPIFPVGFENYIYYEIKPEYRGKGYGNKILSSGLEEARKIGLKEVILTCMKDNIPSQKIIELNGGNLLETGKTNEGKLVYKYQISL